MSQLKTIKRLKVKASQIKEFPFDVVYVVPKTARDIIPRLFPYSLCVPFRAELLALMSTIKVERHYETTLHQTTPLDTVKDAKRGVSVYKILPEAELRQSYCVVPVLSIVPARIRKKGKKDRLPAYLTSEIFRLQPHKEPALQTPFRAVFNDDAELFTPEGIHNPICTICPRSMSHMKGDCSLGEKICHETLIVRPDKRAENREQLSQDNSDRDSSIGAEGTLPSDS